MDMYDVVLIVLLETKIGMKNSHIQKGNTTYVGIRPPSDTSRYLIQTNKEKENIQIW